MTRIGVLHDHPPADGGKAFRRAVMMGIDEVRASGRLEDEVELVPAVAEGLPRGYASAVEDAVRALDAAGVRAILGPSITDNALAVRSFVDERGLPCVNYTGSENARSEFMFQYQVGSLDEEPYVIARHLEARGLRRAAVVADDSIIGRTNSSFFEDAAARSRLEIAARSLLDPGGEDADRSVASLPLESDALVYLGLGLSAHALSEGLSREGWDRPVVANASLMFGYARPDWARAWEGWTYVDVVSERNPVYAAFRDQWGEPAPTLAAGYDMGRLIAQGLARSPEPTRAGLVAGLERVKQLPAALGETGTVMGFGYRDRAALKGAYLVVREWRGERSVEWAAGSSEGPTTRPGS